MKIPPALRDQARQRARDCCEYCQLPQACTVLPHEPDHIRPQKLLQINLRERVEHRRLLMEAGLLPVQRP